MRAYLEGSIRLLVEYFGLKNLFHKPEVFVAPLVKLDFELFHNRMRCDWHLLFLLKYGNVVDKDITGNRRLHLNGETRGGGGSLMTALLELSPTVMMDTGCHNSEEK